MKREGQTFVKVSLEFMDDPKILEAGEAAAYTFIAILLYCKRNRTNGNLTRTQLQRLGVQRPSNKIATLTRVGLLDETPDGWFVHSWFNWHDTPDEQEERCTRNRENGSKGGRPKNPTETEVGLPPERQSRVRVEKSKSRELLLQPPVAKREPDLLFEALAESCGMDWRAGMTPSAKGQLLKALKELREVGATPEQVRERVLNYPSDWELTPTALAKHWPRLARKRVEMPKMSHNERLLESLFPDNNPIYETTAVEA